MAEIGFGEGTRLAGPPPTALEWVQTGIEMFAVVGVLIAVVVAARTIDSILPPWH